MWDDDLMGAGFDDDDLLGAVLGDDDMGASSTKRAKMRALLASDVAPGVPRLGPRYQPMGLGVATFTNVSGTTINLTAAPQRPYRVRKMVIAVTRTGATATGAITFNNLKVGSNDQQVSGGAVPAELFADAVQGNFIRFDTASPGVNISLDISTTIAPGAGDSITVTVGFVGETLG